MRYQSAKDLQEALSEEMHPHTVSSLSRQLTQVMSELFAEDKKRDRFRRKTNRDIAWEEHNAPVEDLDIDLDDIVEEGTLDELMLPSPHHRNLSLESELTRLQEEIKKERMQKLLFICSTIALSVYTFLTYI